MENVKRIAISNFSWKFLERFVAQGITLIVSIIIARMLDPSDYSVVSIVTIFFTFANILISGGLNTALIQKKNADSKDYSTILIASLIISTIVYFILFAFAPLIAKAFKQDSLVLIIRIMSLSLPITAVKSIWCAYVSATLQFKKFFYATLGGTIISGIIGIVMAKKGCGAWALVAQQMSNTVVDTLILILFTRIGITLKFAWSRFKPLFKYGSKILLSNIIGVLYSQLSPLIIGLRFNPDDLSFYTKGQSFPNAISSTATNSLSAVLFPIIAKEQENKEQVLKYTRYYMQIASLVVFPAMIGFLSISDEFILLFLTEKWMPASYYLKIFSICYMFDIIGTGNCETIKAVGKSGIYLIVETIKKAIYFLIIIIFSFCAKTPEILALSMVACTITQIIVNCIPNVKLINYKIHKQLIDVIPSLICSCLMSICVFICKINREVSFFSLLQEICVGISSYILFTVFFNNKSLKKVLSIFKK